MKKKLMSLVVVVAVLVTMLSTTVFAGTGDTQVREIRQAMQKAADWHAGQIFENLDGGESEAIVQEAAYHVFLVAKTGSTSENVTNLENLFSNALKDVVATHEKVVGPFLSESIDLYSNVILALRAMGKDPTNFEGYNIVKMLSDACSTGAVSILIPTSPYNVVSAAAVTAYYKSFSDNINGQYIQVSKETIYNYVKSSFEDNVAITNDNATLFDVDKTLEGITMDEYGYLHVTDAALSALNSSSSAYAGKFGVQWGDYLCVISTITGTGFYNGGFGIDNDAKMVVAFIHSPNESAAYYTKDDVQMTVADVKNASLAKIAAAIDKNGLVDGWGYGPNADSTALSLAAMSAYGRTDEANKLYAGLISLQNADGGFKYSPDTTESDTYATKDALEGLIAYYCMVGNIGSMFDLTAVEAAENNQVQMNTPEKTTWSAGSGQWFTVSSPLPLSELIDVMIDGKSVFGDYISTDADGVMTFAAIGGGTIRAWEGSTYVSFSPEFMATLGTGEHTVRIQSTSGFAETTFNVQAATPQTGDNANIAMYIAIAGVGAAVVTVAFVNKKRSSECE